MAALQNIDDTLVFLFVKLGFTLQVFVIKGKLALPGAIPDDILHLGR